MRKPPPACAEGAARLEHDRKQHDRCDVGERHLRHHSQRARIPEQPLFLKRRQQDRRRPACEQQRVDSGVVVPLAQATAIPPTGASRPAITAARPPRLTPKKTRLAKGMCMPATNINIANPTSARNTVVGSSGSSQPKPLFPITTPAASSPPLPERAPVAPTKAVARQPGQNDQGEDTEAHRPILQPRPDDTMPWE